jgi:hypothetical protein
MAYDFPDAPYEGLLYSPAAGPSYVFSNGTWRQVQPVSPPLHVETGFFDSHVTPEMFGAVGNGVADDTAAFLAFQQWAIALPVGSCPRLEGRVGATYMVANPYWPQNIRKLVFNGNGCKLKNNAIPNQNKTLLYSAGGTNMGTLGSFYVPVPMYRINTAAIGATSVTTITAADAGNLVAGEHVMVGSFDQQFAGQPPGLRYFDYVKVVSVNAGTGAVVLDRALRWPHRSDYPYSGLFTNGDGRACIYKIEEGSLWDIEHEYNDIEFVKNDVSAAGACSEAPFLVGKSIIFRRCRSPYFLPTMLGYGRLEQCVSWEHFEVDKLIDTLEIEECTLKDIYAATSCHSMRVINTTVLEGWYICPKRLEMVNCDIMGLNNKVFPAYGVMRELRINGGYHGGMPSIESNTIMMTIGDPGITWSGGVLTVTGFATSFPNLVIVATAFVGRLVYVIKVDGWPSGVVGRVTSITGGDDIANIAIEFSSPLAGTEKLLFHTQPVIVDINNVNVAGTQVSKKDLLWTRLYRLENFLVSSSLDMQNIPVLGRPVRVSIEVLRPYTGATGGNINLILFDNQPTFQTDLHRYVDLKTAGKRVMTLGDHYGWTGAGGESAGAVLPAGEFKDRMLSAIAIIGSAMASAHSGQLPIVTLEVELENPYTLPVNLQ